MGDGIDKSGYNEASYKMERIHEAQKIIAYVNRDLSIWYAEDSLNGYGYNIKLTQIKNLISEVWGKVWKVEAKKINSWKKIAREGIKIKPIYDVRKIQTIAGEEQQKVLNKENLEWIEEMLYEFNMYINQLLEDAGYSTFTIDTFDGDPYN